MDSNHKSFSHWSCVDTLEPVKSFVSHRFWDAYVAKSHLLNCTEAYAAPQASTAKLYWDVYNPGKFHESSIMRCDRLVFIQILIYKYKLSLRVAHILCTQTHGRYSFYVIHNLDENHIYCLKTCVQLLDNVNATSQGCRAIRKCSA